jgi:hypothetical protein
MAPKYNIDKIKFGTDPGTYEKAIDLYDSDAVLEFNEHLDGYSAVVIGTKPYRVYVSGRYYDRGLCDCYLGQRDILCKHLVAVAIYAVMDGKKMSIEDKEIIIGPKCSGKLAVLNKDDLALVKKSITTAMRYIKSYEGPSRTWFAYQGSLQEGCARLAKIVSDLPVSRQSANLIIKILLRLDDRLCLGGVDDSDGTVGAFIIETVAVLEEYIKLDPSCREEFINLRGRENCFGWEKALIEG